MKVKYVASTPKEFTPFMLEITFERSHELKAFYNLLQLGVTSIDITKEDIEYKIKQCISSTIHSALKRNSKNKTNRTIFYIGCNINFLQNHLEAQFLPEFTWENYGEVWEIDHIKGCCNFDLTKEEEQLKCFHFSNLQPLFKTTKIAKEYGYNNIIGNRNKPKYL